MRFRGPTRLVGLLALLVMPAGACSSPMESGAAQLFTADMIEARIESEIVFLRMRTTPAVHMEALFVGAVVVDDNGCLRLDATDRHTVVWPSGYDFTTAGGTIRVLDAQGDLVGRVGESFRLGGGEVTALRDDMGFTSADRSLAATHCPGRYWIAS